jgi:hypothetical protein
MNSDNINEKGRCLYQRHHGMNRKNNNNNKKNTDKSSNDANSLTDVSKCDSTITYNMDRIIVKTLPFHKLDNESDCQKRNREIMEQFCSKIPDYHQNAIDYLFDSKYSNIFDSIVKQYNGED